MLVIPQALLGALKIWELQVNIPMASFGQLHRLDLVWSQKVIFVFLLFVHHKNVLNLQRSFYDDTADYDYDYDYEYETEEIFKKRRKSKAPQDYDYDYDYNYDYDYALEEDFCFNCAANVKLLPWIAFKINLKPH